MREWHNILLTGSDNRPFGFDFFESRNSEVACPVIILCHGYRKHKDWGHYPLLPKEFTEEGFHFLKFNFSHNGTEPENPGEITDLDRFAINNISRELFDLRAVLDWLDVRNEHPELQGVKIDRNKIYLLGFCRGGSISILTASQDQRIKKLVTWSTIGNLMKRFSAGKRQDEWKDKGTMHFIDSHGGVSMPHDYSLYEDLDANRIHYDIMRAESTLEIPHLLIHGTRDDTAFLGEAIHLMSQNEHASLIKIQGATHTFGGYHPYGLNELPHHAEAAVKYTLAFFKDE